MKFNNLKIKLSPTLKINNYAVEKIENNEEVFHFGFGESRFPVPNILQENLKKYANQHSYLEGIGLKKLRQNISKYLNERYNMDTVGDKIIITPGSKLGIYTTLMALEGDLLHINPSWVSYMPQAKMLNKQVININTKIDNNYFPTAEKLESTIKMSIEQGYNPKIIIFNTPNNPTGQMLSKEQINSIIPVLRKYDITVISDEIYAEVNYKKEHVSFFNHYENTIITSGFSKHLSLGGWRIGYIVLPKNVSDSVINIYKAIISETWSSVNAPVQYAIADTLENYKELDFYLNVCKKAHFIRMQYIVENLKALGIKINSSDGAFYVYPDFENYKECLEKNNIKSNNDLAEILVSKYNVATLSGVSFGEREKFTLRMAYSYLDMENEEKSINFYNQIKDINNDKKFNDKVLELSVNLKKGIEKIKLFLQDIK